MFLIPRLWVCSAIAHTNSVYSVYSIAVFLHALQDRSPQQRQALLNGAGRQVRQGQPGGALGFVRLQNRAAIVELVKFLAEFK